MIFAATLLLVIAAHALIGIAVICWHDYLDRKDTR